MIAITTAWVRTAPPELQISGLLLPLAADRNPGAAGTCAALPSLPAQGAPEYAMLWDQIGFLLAGGKKLYASCPLKSFRSPGTGIQVLPFFPFIVIFRTGVS